MRTAAVARRMGHEPRVAFLSYSTFGNPPGNASKNIRDAVTLLDERRSTSNMKARWRPTSRSTRRCSSAIYPFSAPVRPGQRADHAGAAVGQHLGQAAARTGRRERDRADADRHGKAGADRADDRERVGPGDAGGAGGGRRPRTAAARGGARQPRSARPSSTASAARKRREDRVKMREVVHLDVDVEGVEAAVAVDQLPG